jgi:hypothetical protein
MHTNDTRADSARRSASLAIVFTCLCCLARAPHAQSPGAATFAETVLNAEAASAAKQWSDAIPLWEKVVQANPVNATFAFQLATSLLQAKDYRKAIPAFENALALRAGFPANMAYNIACSYAMLGDKEQAFTWLNKSFDMGLRNLERARVDPDLLSLHDDPRFARIVGLPDMSKMSREDGWRSDLALLAREVKRKGYIEGVYRALSKHDFDAAVKKLNDDIPKLSDGRIVVEMMKLLRLVGDGHTGIERPPAQLEYLLALPLQFYLFKEGLFIIAADPQYKELLGAQVKRFGDRSVDEVMHALDQVISRDNEMWPVQVAPYRMRSAPLLNALALTADPRKVALTIEVDGHARSVTVEADASHPDIWNEVPTTWLTAAQASGKPLPLYLKNTTSNYWFEYQPDSKLLYFQFNAVVNDGKESLIQFSDRLFQFINSHDVSKLVIDLRWNNGGNTGLIPPLLNRVIRSDKVDERGKLFVIIGRRTFSAAQNAATYFERYTNATFVGEPTGSSPNFVGEEMPFILPYTKIVANVSDLSWKTGWPQDYRTWIAPQLYTPPTFAMYRAGRDPAMEAIAALPAR